MHITTNMVRYNKGTYYRVGPTMKYYPDTSNPLNTPGGYEYKWEYVTGGMAIWTFQYRGCRLGN